MPKISLRERAFHCYKCVIFSFEVEQFRKMPIFDYAPFIKRV